MRDEGRLRFWSGELFPAEEVQIFCEKDLGKRGVCGEIQLLCLWFYPMPNIGSGRWSMGLSQILGQTGGNGWNPPAPWFAQIF